MITSRFLIGTLLLYALPVVAQSEPQPAATLPYTIVSAEELVRMVDLKSIKLHLRDVTLKEALQEVAKQTGATIDTSFDRGNMLAKKLSIDIETESLKEASSAIFEEAGVQASLQDFGIGKRLRIQWGNEQQFGKDAPVSGTNLLPIKLLALATGESKILQLTAAPLLNEYLHLNATLVSQVDWRLPFLSMGIEATHAEDDQGRSLIMKEDTTYSSDSVETLKVVDLAFPSKNARTLAHLEGKSTYIFVTKRETWEVLDLLAANNVGHDFQAGETKVRLTIESARKTDGGVEIALTIKELTPTKGSMDGRRHPLMQFNHLATSLRVVDANGEVLENNGFSGGGGSDEIKVRIRYDVLEPEPDNMVGPKTYKEPLKLIINSPSELVQVQVPFSFSDVPLP